MSKPPSSFDLDGLRMAYEDEFYEKDQNPIDFSKAEIVYEHKGKNPVPGFFFHLELDPKSENERFWSFYIELEKGEFDFRFIINREEKFIIDETNNLSIPLGKAFIILSETTYFNYEESYALGKTIFQRLSEMSTGRYLEGIEACFKKLNKINSIMSPALYIAKSINVYDDAVILDIFSSEYGDNLIRLSPVTKRRMKTLLMVREKTIRELYGD